MEFDESGYCKKVIFVQDFEKSNNAVLQCIHFNETELLKQYQIIDYIQCKYPKCLTFVYDGVDLQNPESIELSNKHLIIVKMDIELQLQNLHEINQNADKVNIQKLRWFHNYFYHQHILNKLDTEHPFDYYGIKLSINHIPLAPIQIAKALQLIFQNVKKDTITKIDNLYKNQNNLCNLIFFIETCKHAKLAKCYEYILIKKFLWLKFPIVDVENLITNTTKNEIANTMKTLIIQLNIICKKDIKKLNFARLIFEYKINFTNLTSFLDSDFTDYFTNYFDSLPVRLAIPMSDEPNIILIATFRNKYVLLKYPKIQTDKKTFSNTLLNQNGEITR